MKLNWFVTALLPFGLVVQGPSLLAETADPTQPRVKLEGQRPSAKKTSGMYGVLREERKSPGRVWGSLKPSRKPQTYLSRRVIYQKTVKVVNPFRGPSTNVIPTSSAN